MKRVGVAGLLTRNYDFCLERLNKRWGLPTLVTFTKDTNITVPKFLLTRVQLLTVDKKEQEEFLSRGHDRQEIGVTC